ncbi:MAG TPA: hypothetical protein VK511_12190 [Gemmatimonadaceae bacterium]|nr:hypothetical protein [Gemmatimonadaceae bacterium]
MSARHVLAVLAVLITSHAALAQGVRITGFSSLEYYELMPVAEDSVPVSQTIGSGTTRDSPVGPVSCPAVSGSCYYFKSLSRAHTLPLVQDIEASGWGLGTGISAYVHIRARGSLGGVDDLYPRENDHFDALAAYLELNRGSVVARAGRQWLTSQLGVNNFDGASVDLRLGEEFSVLGYGGWSLIEGLSEPPTSSALAAADFLPPDSRGLLVGTKVGFRSSSGVALSAEYQREIRTDRAGLYSERVAFDASARLGATRLDGDVQADLATGALNELSLRASHKLPWALTGTVEARHYTPFFPLWTIWGVFSPVGYNEARGEARWSSSEQTVSLSADASYRRYEDTHTGLAFLPLRDDGWHVGTDASWRPRAAWLVSGSYGRDIGFGASQSNGSAGVRWTPSEHGYVGVTGTAFQSIYEFSVGSGTVTGVIADAGYRLTSDLRLAGDLAVYQHIGKDMPRVLNWSQRRASLRLEWALGTDPGMRAPRSGVR